MSRSVTPPQSQPLQPNPPPTGSLLKIPHERIAMRAYEKWVNRGRPVGSPVQDWLEAEKELRSEFSRGSTSGQKQMPGPQQR